MSNAQIFNVFVLNDCVTNRPNRNNERYSHRRCLTLVLESAEQGRSSVLISCANKLCTTINLNRTRFQWLAQPARPIQMSQSTPTWRTWKSTFRRRTVPLMQMIWRQSWRRTVPIVKHFLWFPEVVKRERLLPCEKIDCLKNLVLNVSTFLVLFCGCAHTEIEWFKRSDNTCSSISIWIILSSQPVIQVSTHTLENSNIIVLIFYIFRAHLWEPSAAHEYWTRDAWMSGLQMQTFVFWFNEWIPYYQCICTSSCKQTYTRIFRENILLINQWFVQID